MSCDFCAKVPAEMVLLQSASSRILWWNHRKIKATLCGICAERVFYDQQSRTLIQGWWGPLSALATIWFSIANFLRIAAHRKIVSTVDFQGSQSPRPKVKITSNTPAMFVSVIALIVIGSLASSAFTTSPGISTSEPASFNSTCWEDEGNNQLKEVSCSSDAADYETYQVVSNFDLCANLYIAAGSQFACLQEKY